MFHDFTPPLDTLKAMEDSEFTFYLTGSKYFVGQGNDTDFMVSDSANAREFLEVWGFKRLSQSNYTDTLCTRVYRKDKIDVQCISDIFLKLIVQEKFKSIGLTSPTSKEWDIAIALMRE